jgi:AraC-like DNA-binding protein
MNTQSLRRQYLDRIDLDQLLPLLDRLPDVSFFLKDRQGRFIALNGQGREYCGVATEAEAVGRTDFDFFPADRAQAYHEDDLAVMESGQPVVNRIEALPESTRSPRLVVTDKIPVRDADGTIVGVAGFSRQLDEFGDSSGEVSRFAKVIARMHQDFDTSLRTANLAREAGLSVSQFNRRFRQAFGTSARQYLLRVRVEAAAEMLLESNQTVSAVALDCGFYDHAHLTRCFQRLMHCSPTEYRRKRR